MKKGYWILLLHIYLLFCVCFIPFPYFLLRFQDTIAKFLFFPILRGLHVFKDEFSEPTQIDSDSQAIYWIFLLLFFVSLVASFFLFRLRHKRITAAFIIKSSRWILQAFLILQLVKYGADKLFINQFFTPESNILFTPFGKLDRDILYWSVMGLSPGYSIFLGIVEIVTAGLICFPRTRRAGLLLAIGILTNVVAINFGFDISVKAFSLLLLVIAIVLYIWRNERILNPFSLGHPALIFGSYILLFLLLSVEVFYPIILKKAASDPLFIGAYKVTASMPDSNNHTPERFFIHKDGYFILQDKDDNFVDYKLYINTNQKKFIITDYNNQQIQLPYNWNPTDSSLQIDMKAIGLPTVIKGYKLRVNSLPALKQGFHWIAD